MDRRTERIYELRRETAKKNAEERIKQFIWKTRNYRSGTV